MHENILEFKNNTGDREGKLYLLTASGEISEASTTLRSIPECGQMTGSCGASVLPPVGLERRGSR